MAPSLHIPLNREQLINYLQNKGDENLSFARILSASKEGKEREIYRVVLGWI